jgi:hypothetical protein
VGYVGKRRRLSQERVREGSMTLETDRGWVPARRINVNTFYRAAHRQSEKREVF